MPLQRNVYLEEHEQFRESVRKFLLTHAEPYHDEWEINGKVSRAVWQKAGEQGLLAPTVPEEYDGYNVDFRFNSIVNEEVWRSGLTGLGFALHSDIAVPYIVNYASESVKKAYLPQCVTGELITAIAMTEPDAGSDLQGIKTTAIRNGDHYVLNGSKTFITNGQLADWVIVVCKTDTSAGAKGISLLFVDANSEGFERGRNLKKVGLKAQDTSELFFNDVKVPVENLLGEEGKGFQYLMQELPQERLSIAVAAMAACQSVLEQTVEYTNERKAFGKPISALQNTQFKLAEIDAKVTAMQVFVDHCLALHVEGKLDAVTASKAKLLTTELQDEVVDVCLQLHGGYGYMWEYPVARAYADSRIQRVYGGTSEIMKLIIARELFKPK